ncbi:Predicted arabinose efflux permease, MFS family [Granulicella rosea]|uniref:Predicted arabinose efflux permease, MFS family n=1 Tax=Granulicella rosea TaxID=474952 RepID=A0A239MDF8_9BACT|nr:MFS transporter [Granulicella rosea]SNT41057.1 Predicted arabinose efflux permease, MFS family [Granulicella rosea]
MTYKEAYTARGSEVAGPDGVRIGRIVAQSTALVFLGYLGTGLEAAVVPSFVHRELGLSTTLAGAALGAQALATLVNRAFAGRVTDRFGARATIVRGLLLMLASGVLFTGAAVSLAHPLLDFAILMLSRLMLGCAISWVSAAGAVWGIGRAGEANASRVLVWSGVAANAALALGAPAGLWIGAHWSVMTLGPTIVALYAASIGYALTLAEVERVGAEPLRISAVLRRVAPFGSILALCATGYGVFSAFVTLFFQQQGWASAAWPLGLYGAAFIATRILLGRWIDRYSVFQVGLASVGLELAALALLAVSRSAGFALASACLMGMGFSLIFPALCVRTIQAVQPRDRASAISVFTGFLEFALAVAAPLTGLLIAREGYRAGFWAAFLAVCLGFAGLLALRREDSLKKAQG